MALFDDRVEVFSPGSFPGPMIIAELGNGISYSRNPHLRQLARKAGLVEKRGFGYKLIFESCEQNNNPRPVVVEGPSYVKVTLFRSKIEQGNVSFFPEKCRALKSLAEKQQAFQVSEAAKLLGVSVGTARTRLKELIAAGWLETGGKGRSARYIWVRSLGS